VRCAQSLSRRFDGQPRRWSGLDPGGVDRWADGWWHGCPVGGQVSHRGGPLLAQAAHLGW